MASLRPLPEILFHYLNTKVGNTITELLRNDLFKLFSCLNNNVIEYILILYLRLDYFCAIWYKLYLRCFFIFSNTFIQANTSDNLTHSLPVGSFLPTLINVVLWRVE